MTQHSQINPTTFPIFETTNTYLTEGGCCIGGYHSANGAQTYAHFTYITFAGDFSQDVSALSHEVGEWMDDPLTRTRTTRLAASWKSAIRWKTARITPCGFSRTAAQLHLSPAGPDVHRLLRCAAEHFGQQLVYLPELPVHPHLPERILVRTLSEKPASQEAGFYCVEELPPPASIQPAPSVLPAARLCG